MTNFLLRGSVESPLSKVELNAALILSKVELNKALLSESDRFKCIFLFNTTFKCKNNFGVIFGCIFLFYTTFKCKIISE